ncbi:MAG: hypothetical protein KJ052_18645 [Candidatus Hydrogenedentes bacterium]|nr:hypothetical protein [Candidatus Hydrogenedentota bacterium]
MKLKSIVRTFLVAVCAVAFLMGCKGQPAADDSSAPAAMTEEGSAAKSDAGSETMHDEAGSEAAHEEAGSESR